MNTKLQQLKLIESLTGPDSTPERVLAATAAFNQEPENRMEGYISAKEACAFLTVGRTHLWKLTIAGLKCYRLGKRKLYKASDLQAFVEMRSGDNT